MASAAGAFAASAGIANEAVAQGPGDLENITQALADALAPGRADVWEHWTHPDFVLTDENGTRIERKRFLSEMRPLPPGASGTIKVVDFVVRRVGDTLAATYVQDELEHFHGEDLQARYRQTDTWVHTPSGWRLLASQIIALRTDPPSVELSRRLWDEYVGRYRLPDEFEIEVARDGSSGVLRKSSGTSRPLKAELADLLFVPGEPRIRYLVQREPKGGVTGLIERRESWDLVWRRVD
jgi:hypothetical protein